MLRLPPCLPAVIYVFPLDFASLTASLGPYHSLISVRETQLYFSEEVCLFFHGKLLRRCGGDGDDGVKGVSSLRARSVEV